MNTLKLVLLTLSIFVGTFSTTYAESPSDFAFVFLDSDQDKQSDCVLHEKGWNVLKNPVTIAGKRINESECVVAMDVKEFSKTFQMCSLVATRATNTSGSECNFSTASRGGIVEFSTDAGIFKLDPGMPTSASCMWACKLQPSKK